MPSVLIVENCPTSSALIREILESDSRIEVIGEVGNGFEALKVVDELDPDIITMDINMPVMDGLEATGRIMDMSPRPIVILSASYELDSVYTAFQAVNAGALAATAKPTDTGGREFERDMEDLIKTVLLLSEVPVARKPLTPASPEAPQTPAVSESLITRRYGERNESIVAIAAGEGGPPALREFLRNMPPNIPAPVLVVQHMSHKFTPGFASWLAEETGLSVTVAVGGEVTQAGHVYVAPEDHHLILTEDDCLELVNATDDSTCCPAADVLFNSVHRHHPQNSIGVVLSGTGSDGAHRLREMKEDGAMTFVQDANSCLVADMPCEAIRKGGAISVLPPRLIARSVAQCLGMAPIQAPTG